MGEDPRFITKERTMRTALALVGALVLFTGAAFEEPGFEIKVTASGLT